MKLLKTSVFLTALLPLMTFANDSTGNVGTGGVEYIKNDKIAMETEDLFISPKQIKVRYQYKNLTDQDVTETVLFPLPKVDAMQDTDFADTASLIESFKVFSNGKEIKPTVHPRAFIHYLNQDGSYDEKVEDVTEALKSCGLTDAELLNPWTLKFDIDKINTKVQQCDHEQFSKLGYKKEDDRSWAWGSEVIYSWQQTFKANEMTKIEHQYKPLVGGSMSLDFLLKENHEIKDFYCISEELSQQIQKAGKKIHGTFDEVEYIVKTGGNWATPIKQFNLTVEAGKNQAVSFCWNGNMKKVSNQKITVSEQNFTPKQDLNIIFPFVK